MTSDSTSDQALLFGADPAERIVAVECTDHEAVLFFRRENGSVETRHEPFSPFFLLGDPSLLSQAAPGAYNLVELEGGAPLKWLVVADEWPRLWGLIGAVVAASNQRRGTAHTSWREVPDLHVLPWAETQHLVLSGKSSFKAMAFDDLHRLQLDLEVVCGSRGSFPQAGDPQAAIVIAALSDNRGWCELIDMREQTEADLLRRTIETIRRLDPDVIEGHNILAFDLPYLIRRCERHGIKAALGRDGSEPRALRPATRARTGPYAGRGLHIFGRHIIDTLPLVQRYDLAREMESHSLKAAARHLGLARTERVYIDGGAITDVWRSDPERLLEYARDDVMETERLARLLTLPLFYQAQMAPMPYERLAASGVTTRLESLLIREHLRCKVSIPVPDPPSEISGGFTHAFIRGLVRDVLYIDVHSLYPSIIAAHDICPAKDHLRLIPRTVSALLARRLAAKRAAVRASDAAERRRQSAISDSFKILVNSIYGYLGFAAGLWNDFEQADRVTSIGRQIIHQIIGAVREAGGTPIEADTDGLYFVPPPAVKTAEERGEFVRQISDALPQGIEAGLQGHYVAMLSHAEKNYALLDEAGQVIIHGSALRSHGLEPYLRRFLREAIGHMLRGEFEGVVQLHRRLRARIEQRQAPVEWFVRADRLRDSLDEYRRKIETGARGRNAAYELALACGKPFNRGDRIRYYFTGATARQEMPKLATSFQAARPDYSISRYTRRLDEVMAMLASMFPPEARSLAEEGQMDFLGRL